MDDEYKLPKLDDLSDENLKLIDEIIQKEIERRKSIEKEKNDKKENK